MHSGRPMFDLNDQIILDNCPTHCYEGAEALVEFLAQRRSWLIFTPVYSLNSILLSWFSTMLKNSKAGQHKNIG